LKEKLKHYGVENVEDLTLVEDSNNLGMNRGFAFLEFSSRSDAMNAFKRLQKRDVLFGVDRPAKVSFADSFIGPGDEIMAQVNIYLTDMLKIYISSKTGSTVSSTLYAAIFGAVYLVSGYSICP
jgi:RNA recognition motif-containing protein